MKSFLFENHEIYKPLVRLTKKRHKLPISGMKEHITTDPTFKGLVNEYYE